MVFDIGIVGREVDGRFKLVRSDENDAQLLCKVLISALSPLILRTVRIT